MVRRSLTPVEQQKPVPEFTDEVPIDAVVLRWCACFVVQRHCMTLTSGVYKVSGFTLVSLNFSIETMYVFDITLDITLFYLFFRYWGFEGFSFVLGHSIAFSWSSCGFACGFGHL